MPTGPPGATDSPADDSVPDILLDPVGVFTQSSTSTAGGIFEDVARLIHKSPAEEPETHDNACDSATGAASSSLTCPTEQPETDGHSAASRKLRCRRNAMPLNEFTQNAGLLYGAFWTLFPLGSGLPCTGPLTPTIRRHLMTQWHNVFAHSPQLIFLLADQVQRHAAARGVALRIKADTDWLQRLHCHGRGRRGILATLGCC